MLRLTEGAQFQVTDKYGTPFLAIITAIAPIAKAKVLTQAPLKNENPWINKALFGWCKGDKNEWVIEKSTELGVRGIGLWIADHSVVKLTFKDRQAKLERYQKIAETAAKQCGRNKIPVIETFDSLKAALEGDQTYIIWGALTEEAIPLGSAVLKLPKPLNIVIGPEGDLSDKEKLLLSSLPSTPVTLGPLVLRAETAMIAAIVGTNIVLESATTLKNGTSLES